MTGTRSLSGSPVYNPGVSGPAQRDVPRSTRSAGLASVEHLVSQWLSAGCSPGDQGEARPQLASCTAPVTLLMLHPFTPS